MHREHDEDSATPASSGAAAARCCGKAASPPAPTQPVATGSRRRRLWELDSHAHCPVVGLCLPVAPLRRLVAKADGAAPPDDYDMHCEAVAACKQRSAIAEAVQRELDRRHAHLLRAAASQKSAADLLAWWEGERFGPQLAGAFWAALTHARCTAELERRVLGHVHMQQHELGRVHRATVERAQQAATENAALQRERAAVAARSEEAVREHARQREALQAELVRLRGELLAREALVAQLHDEATALHRAAPDLPARKALSARLQEQTERARGLHKALERSREEVQRLRAAAGGEADAPHAREPAAPRSVRSAGPSGSSGAANPHAAAAPPAEATPLLGEQSVLCVGGRTSAVPLYRRLVEETGARFLHHDGGAEDNVQRLEATLAAADLVICQTGCVSHHATWRVKDHCRRTGKRCVFVGTPSASGMQRALAEAAWRLGEGADVPQAGR